MKIAQIAFACDRCDEESTPETSAIEARRLARLDGWRIGPSDLCPACLAVDLGVAAAGETTP